MSDAPNGSTSRAKTRKFAAAFASGVIPDDAIERFDALRARPWTVDELEAVRDAALALVRSHAPVDLPGKRTVAGFSGPAFWALLGALDRNPYDQRGYGE